MMVAMGMSESEQTAFIGVMRARYDAPHATCPELDSTPGVDQDCLSAAMIWEYLKSNYQDTSSGLSGLKDDLVGILATDMGGNQGLVTKIRNASGMARDWTTWDASKFDFTSAGSFVHGQKVAGFASRVGQICSAYINRQNGDSWSRFNKEKEKDETANEDDNPYGYGFLVAYRVFLDVCPPNCR